MHKKKALMGIMILLLVVVRVFTTIPHFEADAVARDVPVRPEPAEEPIVDTQPTVIENRQSSVGAVIVLDASSNPTTGMWTNMQWYVPSTNEWIDVAGWEGQFTDGKVQWWVGEDNLGQGPFRWRVYSDPSKSTLLKTSEEFYLPAQKNLMTTVRISWP